MLFLKVAVQGDSYSAIKQERQKIKARLKIKLNLFTLQLIFEVVVAQWCNRLTLKPEQSGRVGSRRDRASPLERHDKGSRTRFALSYFCDPSSLRTVFLL